MKKLLLLPGTVFLLLSCSTKIKVDLLVYHATIYTVDSSFSVAEAMAVNDGKIVATGKTSDLQSKYEAKEALDAQGKFIYPGFIDAHAHFVGYGQSLFTVDLYDSKSIDEVVQRVRAFDSAHPGEPWILGRGWDQNKFPGKTFPTNDELNNLFPDKPVLLERVDGHGDHREGFPYMVGHGFRRDGAAGIRTVHIGNAGEEEHVAGDRSGRGVATQHARHLPQMLHSSGDIRGLSGWWSGRASQRAHRSANRGAHGR